MYDPKATAVYVSSEENYRELEKLEYYLRKG